MTKLYVAEYAGFRQDVGGTVGIGPAVANTVVDYSGGVAYSNAFNTKTRCVRLQADSVCAFRVSRKSRVTYQSDGSALGTANNGAPLVSGFTTDVSTAGITPVAATANDERLTAGEERWIDVGPGQCVSVITAA